MIKKFIPLIVLFCACSPTFQIKPKQEVPILESNNKTISDLNTATNQILEMQASPLSEDQIIEIFDGNLLLAGTIPIDVTLSNKSKTAILFTEKDFSLTDPQGQKFSNLKAKDAFESLFDYYKIKAYNPASYEKIKANFLTHSINLKDPILPDENRKGLLFFKLKKGKTISKKLELQLSRKKIFTDNLKIVLN
jgi:hypothetical protein